MAETNSAEARVLFGKAFTKDVALMNELIGQARAIAGSLETDLKGFNGASSFFRQKGVELETFVGQTVEERDRVVAKFFTPVEEPAEVEPVVAVGESHRVVGEV